MNDQEFILSILAIVMGTAILSLAIVKITGLIKAWVYRGKNTINEENFDRLARAFMQHKKDMQERVQNLETIIAGEEQENPDSFLKLEKSKTNNGLTNDLQQKKNRVKS